MDMCNEDDNFSTNDVPLQPSSSSSSRKRRHLDSTNDGNASATVSSLEILERAQSTNFEELARQYPKFRAAWTATKSAQKNRGHRHAAFSSCVTQEFSIELTRALLQALFRLKLPHLDEDHLCPPIPNRFFHLHWIHTKLMSVGWARRGIYGNTVKNNYNNSRGLDIGSGASCIYSMLAARFYRSKMITSEIDPKSVALAKANVAANHLSSMIAVLQVPPSRSQRDQGQQHEQLNVSSVGGPLHCAIEVWFRNQSHQSPPFIHCLSEMQKEHADHLPDLTLDFVMTNPPFYDPSSMEISAPRAGDGRARTNMTVSEGNYPGGEVGFVTEMIEDSLRLSDWNPSGSVASWYSSMLGKKTSLVQLQKLLVHVLGPAHVEITEYGPGQYTRWFLAWTLEQPPANASGALCPKHEKDDFEVLLTVTTPLSKDPLQEVADRIVAFCETSSGSWDLEASVERDAVDTRMLVRITEAMPQAVTHFVDEGQNGVEIPDSILRILYNRKGNAQFLPEEGHFLVEAEIQQSGNHPPLGQASVAVRLSCYKHSLKGSKAIEKIRNSMAGEICRTNRKWRKMHQRQQEQ